MVENGWKFIWVAAIMILLPFVSSLVGIILGSIQLKKTSTKPVKIGVLLSCTGLARLCLARWYYRTRTKPAEVRKSPTSIGGGGCHFSE